MTAETLKVASMFWLRIEKRCPIVVFEHSADWHSRADVYAVDSRRYSIEIETKISAADLKREQGKSKYMLSSLRKPSYYYLCVPDRLVPLALEIKKPEWGVLTPSNCYWAGGAPILQSKASATRIHDKRVSMQDCVRLVMRQAAMLSDMALSLENYRKLVTQN